MTKFGTLIVAAIVSIVVGAIPASAQHHGGGGGHGGGGWHGGGYWHGGWYGGGWYGVGYPWWGWGWGAWPGYYYPYYQSSYPAYPYGSYDYSAPTYIQQQAPAYTEQRSFSGQGEQYSYYCPDPAGYYPQVPACAKGWLRVVPPTAPGPVAPAPN